LTSLTTYLMTISPDFVVSVNFDHQESVLGRAWS